MSLTVSRDGRSEIVTLSALFAELPDDADLCDVLIRARRGEPVHTRLKDGSLVIITQQQPEPAVSDEPQQQLLLSPPPRSAGPHPPPGLQTYLVECTVFVAIDLMVRCQAPDEETAHDIACEIFVDERTRLLKPTENGSIQVSVEVDPEYIQHFHTTIDQCLFGNGDMDEFPPVGELIVNDIRPVSGIASNDDDDLSTAPTAASLR